MTARWMARAGVALLRHPPLWSIAVLQLFVLAPRGWWRRRPFLPSPDPEYLRFRLQTAYGDPEREPEPVDVITYLNWCRGFRRVAR